MHPLAPVFGILTLVAAATAIGLLLRARKGRVRKLAGAERLEPAALGIEHLGTAGTIVQFSTDFCSRCPGVRRLLSQRVDAAAGVDFVHVDLTHDPELAARFGVLQTPTILFVDADGHPNTRLSGQLDHETIREAVDVFVGGADGLLGRQAASGASTPLAHPQPAHTHPTTTGALA